MLSNNLKKIRLMRNLTQIELSKKAGVSQSAISDIETGKRPNPSITIIKCLADALGVNVNDLFKQ